MLQERRIDLHTHSNVSDGTLTPTALVELAAKKGLAAIALTDHDHLGGIPEARAAGDRVGVEVVAGIELSLDWEGHDLHMLAYLVDPAEPRLAAALARFRDVRAQRGARIVQKLRDLDVDISLHEIPVPTGAALGRPHIARALMEKRIVASVQEAFDRYLADGRPAYVPKEKLAPADAIRLVHGAGGIAVLAHPGILPEEARYRSVRALAAIGLDGVEVEHPRHDSTVRHRLREMAAELGLAETGGSDFHGENKPDVDLGYGVGGNVKVTTPTLEILKAKARSRG